MPTIEQRLLERQVLNLTNELDMVAWVRPAINQTRDNLAQLNAIVTELRVDMLNGFSNVATRTEIAELRRELATVHSEMADGFAAVLRRLEETDKT